MIRMMIIKHIKIFIILKIKVSFTFFKLSNEIPVISKTMYGINQPINKVIIMIYIIFSLRLVNSKITNKLRAKIILNRGRKYFFILFILSSYASFGKSNCSMIPFRIYLLLIFNNSLKDTSR